MSYLLTGGTVVTMDAERTIYDRADVLVVGDRVAAVGTGLAAEGAEVLDCTGSVVIPGLINAHTHTFQTLYRGLGDGLSFSAWQREVTYPLYQVLSPEDAYIFSLVGCLENLRSGVTSAVNFQAYPNSAEAVNWTARAFREAGLAGVLVKSFFGGNGPPGLVSQSFDTFCDETAATLLSFSRDPLLKVWLGPPLPTQAPAEWIVAAHGLASSYGAGLHMHISESEALAATYREQLGGQGELEFLDALGVVDHRFHAAHCVGLTERDTEIMAERGAHVMHCPESNMYLASGVAPVERFRSLGINVTLGTDGPASNNNQNMFSAMKTASLLQRVARLQPDAMPPGTALELATTAGAKALGRSDLGAIAPGMRADIAVVRLQSAHTVVANRPVSTLVFCCEPADVTTVLVAGDLVLSGGRSTRVDEEALLAEAEDRARSLLHRAQRDTLRAVRWPWA